MMPVTPTPVVERLGDIDRVLAGQRVGHEQRFMRINQRLDGGDFGHQLLVDMLAAGGIQDHTVIAADACALAMRAFGDGQWILACNDGQGGDAGLLAQARATAPSRRGGWCPAKTIKHALLSRVCSKRPNLALVVVLPEPCRPTIRMGAGGEPMLSASFFLAQGLDQHVMDDLDDLLAGRDGADDVFANGAWAHRPAMKSVDHRQRAIGFDQGGAHFPQGGIDIGLSSEAPLAAKLVEDAGQGDCKDPQTINNSKQS